MTKHGRLDHATFSSSPRAAAYDGPQPITDGPQPIYVPTYRLTATVAIGLGSRNCRRRTEVGIGTQCACTAPLSYTVEKELNSVVLFMGYRRFPRPLPNGGRLTVNGDTRYAIGFGIPLCLRTYVRTSLTCLFTYARTYVPLYYLRTYVRTYVHTYRSVFRGLYLLGSVKKQQASSKQQLADRRYVGDTYVGDRR